MLTPQAKAPTGTSAESVGLAALADVSVGTASTTKSPAVFPDTRRELMAGGRCLLPPPWPGLW